MWKFYTTNKPPIKSKYTQFISFENMKKHYEDEKNSKMLTIIEFVKSIACNLNDLLDEGLDNIVKDESYADVVFSTAHQYKGCESDYVLISNDFADYCNFSNNKIKYQNYSYEEINIIFVALTRARQHLYIQNEIAKELESVLKYSF